MIRDFVCFHPDLRNPRKGARHFRACVTRKKAIAAGRKNECTMGRFFGSEQEFVGASPFMGFLSMGLFVSHGLRDWRALFAGLFRDSWSSSGAAGIARPAPASGRRASGTGWNAVPVSEIPSRLTGNSRTGQ